MKVFGISISYEEIEIDNESDYRGAIADGAVGNYLDPELSYLRGGGTVIVDAGHVIDPYGHGNDDLLELLAPVLEHVDAAVLARYVLGRLAEHMEVKSPTHKRNYGATEEQITWAVNDVHAEAIRKRYPDANVWVMPAHNPDYGALFNADPDCVHEIVAGDNGSGIKCAKCPGWYCA